jgi:hypothetical protein
MKINERDISPAAVLLQLMIDKGMVTEDEYFDARKRLAETLSAELSADIPGSKTKGITKSSKVLQLSDFLNKRDE